MLVILVAGALVIVSAQTPALKPSVITGDVVSLGTGKIVVKATTGEIVIQLTDKTLFKRVSAQNPPLPTAPEASLADISVGDKLMATGILSADGKSLPARTVYLMKESDIAQKHAKEEQEWRTRGITGKVTAVNSQTNQITVDVRGLVGTTTTVLTPKEKAKYLRYAPNSIRFDEAKASSIDEVKPGDMLRALGDRSSDGTAFNAEAILTGAFQTTAGTVKSIDTEKNEVVIKNLQNGKDVTVALNNASTMKRFPAETAERMAGMQTLGAGGIRPAGQGVARGQGPPTGAPGQGRGGFGGGGARGGGNIDDMLERFPNITAADLKAGDMIAVSSTKDGNLDQIRAIKLLAGVEPFIRMAQTQNQGRRGQGVDFGNSIPGLEGIGFP